VECCVAVILRLSIRRVKNAVPLDFMLLLARWQVGRQGLVGTVGKLMNKA
jgi:hypothetical protein